MAKPRVWMSWSSGKDSAVALHEVRQHAAAEIVGLLTTVTETFERVAMHAVRETLVERQAEKLGFPPSSGQKVMIQVDKKVDKL
ncbi:MAG: hypothetical protein HY581_07780 [Nitrospirae bacterium]|nr:hypothetical protein [Nitrospirota bacterium]